jgi:hypothetical protein
MGSEFGYTAFILPPIKPPYLAELCRKGGVMLMASISPEVTYSYATHVIRPEKLWLS